MQNRLSSRLLSKNLKIKIYRTVILSFVLYGCEIWSLTLREERKLRVFQNMVLRRIFGPRKDEVPQPDDDPHIGPKHIVVVNSCILKKTNTVVFDCKC